MTSRYRVSWHRVIPRCFFPAVFPFSRAIVCARVCVYITCANYSDRYHANMEATPVSTNMLVNVSPPMLLFLTALIAGGIVLLIRYVINRRSRSSLEQDSSKSKRLRSSFSRNCTPLARIRIGTFVLLLQPSKNYKLHFKRDNYIFVEERGDKRSECRNASKTNVPCVMPLYWLPSAK